MKWFRQKFLHLLKPVTIFLGNLHMPYSRKLIDGRHYFEVQKLLKPGQALVTYTRGEVSNVLIPGHWSHVGLYIGKGIVVEAVGRGVVLTDIITFMMKKDYVSINESIFADETTAQKAASWASTKVGLPYDYHFMGGNNAFYCAELVYAAFNEAMNGKSPFVPREIMGVNTVTPDDIIKATSKWKCVWTNRK